MHLYFLALVMGIFIYQTTQLARALIELSSIMLSRTNGELNCDYLVEQVVHECKEIYENSLIDGNPPKGGFVFPKVKALAASKGGLWRKLT